MNQIFNTAMKSFSNVLYNCLLKYPENVAFNIDGNNYSYLQLMKRIAFIQSALLQNKNSLNSISIIANQDFETYSILIAALLSGITYVPVEPSHPDERNNHIVKVSNVNAIFCSDFSSLSNEFRDANKHRFLQLDAGETDIDKLQVLQKPNPAYILFTSGSTGVPKGVPISMQNLHAFIDNVDGMMLEINEQSRFLQVFELTFDLSVFSYLVPLLYGASVYIPPKAQFKQMAAIQMIAEQSITHVLTVPSFVSYLKPFFAKIKLATVKNWLFCGEALKSDLVAEWNKCIPNSNIYNVYGPTEATIFCTSYKCMRDSFKEYRGITCIGKPFKGVSFGLFDGILPIHNHNTNAELCISGTQLTSGYLHNPDKNKAAFFSFGGLVYYRSGDLCHFDDQGDYFFVGRNDNQVKVNGYRVEISELEYHARDFPEIDEAVVVVKVNDKNDQQVLNLIYTAKDELNKDAIIGFLSKKIPSYMLPVNIYFVESIPYNLNGKIDKTALAEQITKIN
jgi:amino acid adenylation domain-containing protein